jgi:aspartate racemase
MKTIGLIGGMSWQSSLEYYRLINEAIKAKLGGLHSAKCILYSVDFAEIEPLMRMGSWNEIGRRLRAAARSLEAAGADFVLLCANTMHRTADGLQKDIGIPLLHIGDATAQAITRQQLRKVGLLGTKVTMEDDFYRGRLTRKHGLDVVVPPENERDAVHRIIFDELCLGQINPRSRSEYTAIMENLIRAGAEGIVLGCTEIGLLVSQRDCRVPIFDTTRIHAEAASEYALSDARSSRDARR